MLSLTRVSGSRIWWECLVVFSVFLLVLGLVEGSAMMSIFQERDVFRARQILLGASPFLGPETNRGSSLPGAFFYYLLAFALYLRDSMSSTYFLLASMQAATLALGYACLASREGRRAGVIYLLLYGGSSFTVLNFLLFYNPSYLPVFALACLICCERFATRGHVFWLLGAGLVSGLALQIQGSSVALVIFGFVVACRSLLSPLVFLSGLLLAYLPWAPGIYTGYRSGGAALLPSYSFGLLLQQLTEKGLPTVSYFVIKNTLSAFGPALTLVGAALLFARRSEIPSSNLERMAGLAAVCALPSALYYLITNFGERYALLFHFFLMIALSLWLARRHWTQVFWIRALVSITFALAVAGSFFCSNYRIFRPERFTISDARALARGLAEHGYTDYSRARDSLYGVGFFKEMAFGFQLEEAVRGAKVRAERKPDGFFLARKDMFPIEGGALLVDEDIRGWLKEGALALAPAFTAENSRILMQPYFSGHGTVMPKVYGNIGKSYIDRVPYAEPTLNLARNFGDGFLCEMGASWTATQDPKVSRLKIFGLSLSSTLVFVTPACVAQLSKIYLEYTCGGAPARMELLSRLGPVYKNQKGLMEVASAPIELEIRLPCVAQKIELGYESSTFLNINGPIRQEGGARVSLKSGVVL